MDIKIQHLTKTYGFQKAVDDVSFEVKTGEILGFLGPNGAGKTTLMKAVAGLLTPAKGKITVQGDDITGLSPAETVAKGLTLDDVYRHL